MRSGVFPPWTDRFLPVLGLTLLAGVVLFTVLAVLGINPEAMSVGYMPDQPVAYSHAVHAGQLGMDCRFCHNTVERTAQASIPPTQTCMNCHKLLQPESQKLTLVRESHATGMPIRWIRVHELPDYVYFNHSAHVSRGVGCLSCHGRVDKMEVVYQVEPLSMGWCLDCHREPERHLRPRERVTDLEWVPEEDQLSLGLRLRKAYDINPSTDCSTCHR